MSIWSLLGLIFWPVGLLLMNQNIDYLTYILPAILLALSFFIYTKTKWFFLPIFVIPLISIKLLLLPLFIAFFLLITKRQKNYYVFIVLSLLLVIILFPKFKGQTIFQSDYEAKQLVIRNTQLYDNVFLARAMHNKARIVLDKFNDHFFALTSPNTYFFAFHPREMEIGNQNIQKYPFLSIIFVLIGIYSLTKLRNWKFVIILFVSSVLALSFLTVFDRHDVILAVPIGILYLSGIKRFFKVKPKNYYYSLLKKLFIYVFCAFLFIELLRIFIS